MRLAMWPRPVVNTITFTIDPDRYVADFCKVLGASAPRQRDAILSSGRSNHEQVPPLEIVALDQIDIGRRVYGYGDHALWLMATIEDNW